VGSDRVAVHRGTATVGAGDATFTMPGGIGDEMALYLP
jgi:hypothetical protein